MHRGKRVGHFVSTFDIAIASFVLASCSSDAARDAANTGGAASAQGGAPTAGASSSGGVSATGGSAIASGGSPGGPGGAAAGGLANGGSPVTGGRSSSGGASSGGAAAGGTNDGGASTGASGNASGGAASGGAAGSAAFTLTSPDHVNGAKFADEFTCALAGFNGSISPELRWTAGPAGTKSYAITFIDVTLAKGTPPNMNGYHWAIWHIPASTTSLPKGFKNPASIQASQTGNFLGPCPNIQGSGHTDTYEFTIYALASEALTVSPASGTAAVKDAESKLEMTHLASAKLVGTSDAKPP